RGHDPGAVGRGADALSRRGLTPGRCRLAPSAALRPEVPRQPDAPGMHGILVVAKPAGPTSHDVVALVRRLGGTRRIGHGGTLDPFAPGVLALFLGGATPL